MRAYLYLSSAAILLVVAINAVAGVGWAAQKRWWWLALCVAVMLGNMIVALQNIHIAYQYGVIAGLKRSAGCDEKQPEDGGRSHAVKK